jgi:hypothetical protein
MATEPEKRLTPAEVEMVLRRASELSARRPRGASEAASVSPEVLIQVAAAAGIPEADVRRAMWDLASEQTAEPHTLAWKLYGPSRLRTVREIEHPQPKTRDYLESLLRRDQGLKMRLKTDVGSLWDPGDSLGAVRRALDFSGHRTLLKTHAVELRVEEIEEERCEANLTADVSNQRGEYLSLGGILGATLALPVAIAGFQNALFFLAIIPALVAPGLGFRLAYMKACSDIRRALDDVLDAAEEGPPEQELQIERPDRPPGEIRGLKPIPRFTPHPQQKE